MCDAEKDWHERAFREKVDKERDFSAVCIFAVFSLTTKFFRMVLHSNDKVVTIVYRI
jgi:hypothetical protein